MNVGASHTAIVRPEIDCRSISHFIDEFVFGTSKQAHPKGRALSITHPRSNSPLE
jgi:hypothetical protein